jgi:hypothetical protein
MFGNKSISGGMAAVKSFPHRCNAAADRVKNNHAEYTFFQKYE